MSKQVFVQFDTFGYHLISIWYFDPKWLNGKVLNFKHVGKRPDFKEII